MPVLGLLVATLFSQDAGSLSAAAFASLQAPIKAFLKERHPRPMNTVCVVAEPDATGAGRAWVLWREGSTLVLWEGEEELVHSRRILDLRRDVVATDKDVGSSTYLVSRTWVDALTKRCAREGVTAHFLRSEL